MPLVTVQKLVYRFLGEAHALEFLQTGKLRVGRLRELNDPLDCEPLFVDAGGTPVDAEKNEYLGNLLDSVGLVCYSGSVNDPVSWTHYADAHRGVALGIEFQDKAGLFEVEYRNDRPKVDYSLLERLSKRDGEEGDALIRLISDGFTVKSMGWAYEKEFRQFLYLNAGMTMIGRNYFRRIGPAHLKRVVLGVRCGLTVFDARQALGIWIRPHGPRVQIVKAIKDPNSFLISA